MFNFKNYTWKHYRISMVVIVTILAMASSLMLYLSGDHSLMKRQIMGFLLGLAVLAVVSLLDYHFVCKLAILYYAVVIIMLALVRFSPLGEDHTTGAYRWLSLGPLDLQVSELAKIALIIIMAVFCQKYRHKMDRFATFLIACAVMAFPTFLILIQTDLSSSMVMVFIFAVMMFVAGLSYKIIVPILAVGLPSFAVLVWYVQQPYQILLSGKQQERVLGFFNPELYSSSYMYQQIKSVQAISSGGVYGKFISGNLDAYRNHMAVYVSESDFIFSIAGEEFGFIGCCILIILLAILIVECLVIAKKSRDFLGYMIAIGVSAMFAFQVFVNIGVATSLLPNTGLPLPFLSYGLSSMISSMIALGMVINIGLQRKR
ncbi:FtsW/RodA/SpoVE family cell cycle protein [Anaerolentibacter hominis]|uniref:FtsW/RodA/SpoVE family cell cycle protein n=1 Tax=Anaerolentibacter hominis TaxID=3079009 RepID=UPI0031B7F589